MLVWEDSTPLYKNLLSAFTRAPRAAQKAILDMSHPPLTALRMKEHRKHADILAASGDNPTSMAAEDIHRLICIANCNAHDWLNHGHPSTRGGQSALFEIASKLNHSCDPNVTYSSRTHDGTLVYRAIRPIAKGDELAFCYLDIHPTQNTRLRRDQLRVEKYFECHCARCDAPDYCRPLPCPQMGCSERVFLRGTDSCWECPSCGAVVIDALQETIKREEDLSKELDKLMMSCRADIKGFSPPLLVDFTDKASESLGPTHALTLTALRTLAIVYSSRASMVEQLLAVRGFGSWRLNSSKLLAFLPILGSLAFVSVYAVLIMGISVFALSGLRSKLNRCDPAQKYKEYGLPDDLRTLAAETYLRVATGGACIATGCTNIECYKEFTRNMHPPCYQSSKDAFLAARALLQIAEHTEKYRVCVELVLRHVPNMQIAWGVDDHDVQAIEEMARKVAPVSVNAAPKGSVSTFHRKGKSSPFDNVGICSVCAKCEDEDGVDLKACARCETALYCGRDCQKSAWSIHKEACSRARGN